MRYLASPGTPLFAVVLLHSALAAAQPPGGERFDRDRGGKLSRDEMPEPARDRSEEIDENADGFVTGSTDPLVIERSGQSEDRPPPKEFTMFERAGHMIEILGNQPPETFIGALFLALLMAVTTAGAYRWLVGRKPDALMPLVGLILLANLACILAAFSLSQLTVPTARVVLRSGRPPRDRIIDGYDHYSQPDTTIGSGASSARHPR